LDVVVDLALHGDDAYTADHVDGGRPRSRRTRSGAGAAHAVLFWTVAFLGFVGYLAVSRKDVRRDIAR
jgi:hypothetical protein